MSENTNKAKKIRKPLSERIMQDGEIAEVCLAYVAATNMASTMQNQAKIMRDSVGDAWNEKSEEALASMFAPAQKITMTEISRCEIIMAREISKAVRMLGGKYMHDFITDMRTSDKIVNPFPTNEKQEEVKK
jgi:hypothetical protein